MDGIATVRGLCLVTVINLVGDLGVLDYLVTFVLYIIPKYRLNKNKNKHVNLVTDS